MDDGQWIELFKHCVCLWSFGAYGTSFSHCLKSMVESSRKTVSFIEGNREDGLKFELSLEDHAKLSRKALESGCSLEELVARHLHSIL